MAFLDIYTALALAANSIMVAQLHQLPVKLDPTLHFLLGRLTLDEACPSLGGKKGQK